MALEGSHPELARTPFDRYLEQRRRAHRLAAMFAEGELGSIQQDRRQQRRETKNHRIACRFIEVMWDGGCVLG